MRLTRLISGLAALTTVASLAVALPAGAAKSGGGKSGGGTISSTSSLTLVLLNSTDGLAHYGQSITYKVSTSATTQPFVETTCTQNGVVVLTNNAGFYPGYLWPAEQVVMLTTPLWTSGAADCTAKLEMADSHYRPVVITSITFHVSA